MLRSRLAIAAIEAACLGFASTEAGRPELVAIRRVAHVAIVTRRSPS